MYVIENLLIGIVSGLTASGIILFALYRCQPNIEISPYIAKHTTSDGEVQYGFKFLNKTRYPICDVSSMVQIRTSVNVGDGKIFNVKGLMKGSIWHVPAYDKKDKDSHYAKRFYKAYDLKAEWSDGDAELEFIVMAKHQLSGISKVTKHTWYSKNNSIQVGQHEIGDSLEVG